MQELPVEKKWALGGIEARDLGATMILVEPECGRVTGKKEGGGKYLHKGHSLIASQLVPTVGGVTFSGTL